MRNARRRTRQLSLAQRRKLLAELPEIAEFVPPAPGDTWDWVANRSGWTGKQLMFQAEFELFDAFPEEVRRALHESVCTWQSKRIAPGLNTELDVARLSFQPRAVKNVIQSAVHMIRQADANDIVQWADVMWPRRFGPYPHIAAGVTILRYHSAGDVRRYHQRRKRRA